jgi:enoyl-CoA hydratase/carnithine racemase
MRRPTATGTDVLLAAVDGAVGVLTFDRPERRNALGGDGRRRRGRAPATARRPRGEGRHAALGATEAAAMIHGMSTAEHREAAAAFVEKRSRFTGR